MDTDTQKINLSLHKRLIVNTSHGRFDIIQYEDGVALRAGNGELLLIKPKAANSVYIEAVR